MIFPFYRAGSVLAITSAVVLAGCSAGPGASDISPFIEEMFACNQMEVDKVKKTDGMPAKDGHYGIEYSFHVRFKGGAEGAQKLMNWYVTVLKHYDPTNSLIEGCNFAVIKDWYEYTDAKRISDPQYPAPIGANVYGTAEMLKSEQGWRLLGKLDIQNAEFVDAPPSARAYVAVPKPVAVPQPTEASNVTALPPPVEPATPTPASPAAAPEEVKPVAALNQGPSFDCMKATTAVEKAICAEPKLALLDASMADAYKAVLAIAPDKDAIKRQQSDWRRTVRDACPSTECLAQAYQVRLGQLK